MTTKKPTPSVQTAFQSMSEHADRVREANNEHSSHRDPDALGNRIAEVRALNSLKMS